VLIPTLLLLFSTTTHSALAAPVKNPDSDNASYEAITGESADDDKTVWDEYYKNRKNLIEKEPAGFLKDNITQIPKGKAFVPAMGEGRNAIYLAKNGFIVDGNDISEVAIEKALAEAKKQHVTIKTIVADLNQYQFPENYYDFIIVSYFYEKKLIPQLKKALKKGGLIMFFNQLESQGNGRMASPDDFPVKSGALKDDFKDFQMKVYREYLDRGIKVVGLLAKKP
jgi:tellurite methyltransferase